MSDKHRVPRTKELEFGGTLGAAVLLFLMPTTVFYLLLTCVTEQASVLTIPGPLPALSTLWNPNTVLLLLAWIFFQAVLYLLPLGKVTEGTELRDQTKLQYRINAFQALIITVVLVGVAMACGLRLSYIYDHFLQLAVSASAISLILSILLYIKSFYAEESALATGGNSGNPMYDFFIGHELNPRLGTFDLKYFCELRPGLIGWALINLAMLVKEMELRGSPSLAMILVNAFQLLYVVDALWNEEAILTTMDIVNDGFGFMLVFGDLAWVPFTYSLQAFFLVNHPHKLSALSAIGIIVLNTLGYAIFRGANSQKNTFRRNPMDPRVVDGKLKPRSLRDNFLFPQGCGRKTLELEEATLPLLAKDPHFERSGDYLHCHRKAPPSVGLVGFRPSSQLPGRPYHGLGLVPALWRDPHSTLFLCHLFHCPAGSS